MNGQSNGTVTPLLETKNLTKKFGDLIANNQINIAAYPGEVHAVLGENGAGKSTLMKLLYGYYEQTSGDIFIDGKLADIRTPLDGRKLGVGMVFQDFTLIPALTVIENVSLFLPDLGVILNRKAIEKQIAEVSARYDLHVDVHETVSELSMGQRQKVEILKILLAGARILIFDEPTSVLAPHEVDGLFAIFNKLRDDGYAILFITHKMPEVLASANRITVLRRGTVVGTMLRAEATEEKLISILLGAEPPKTLERPYPKDHSSEVPLLRYENIELPNPHGGLSLKDINLELYAGEIVGVAGVSGNGQEALGDVALGVVQSSNGRLYLGGKDATDWGIEEILEFGTSCIPADPLPMGAVPGMVVAENMILGEQTDYQKYGGLSLDWPAARGHADELLNTTFVSSPPGLDVHVETLSGGNLQRVLIARELGRSPKLLLAYYPARGLDISNATAARRLLLQYRDNGTGILLVSEDLEELFTMSDRLIVMYHGEIVGSFKPEETTTYEVGRLMTGAKKEEMVHA